MPAHCRRHIQQQKDPEYPAYDYLYYDYYDIEADNSNRRRKTDSFSDVKMNAILERALEKVRSAKRRISEAVKATSSSAEEEEEE